VGTLDVVFAAATNRAYDPLLAALERHPTVRLTLHYTGPLFDWLGQHRPGHLERLRDLVEREQVELLGGAYYEPILVAIPTADKLGQIQKMATFLRETFGCEPTGAWLAERVWEPHLPKPLAQAGIRYTVLDDTPFKMAGLRDEDLFGSYVTEEEGHVLQVFGNSTALRYAIPWHPVEEVIDWLREQARNSRGQAAVMADDGEKFGLWPGTWELCWGTGGWMERFFAALEESEEWLETAPLGEVAVTRDPLGRVYLPCASYEEMMHWALPPDDFAALGRVRKELVAQGRQDVLRFVRGGLWRTFLARYDEANQMHKKMLWVSGKAHRMPAGEARDRALEHLWAAQCNCAYWHGVFGGTYLMHVRAANYAHLIAAEELVDSASLPGASAGTPGAWARVEQGDLDADGHQEIVLNTDRQVLLFKPSSGGTLVEWDWRARRANLLNTMTRRREGYHGELLVAAQEGRTRLPGEPDDAPEVVRVKEADVHTRLFHDWYRRAGLIDHFLHPETTPDDFYRGQYGEQGDFVDQPYQAQVVEREGEIVLHLTREGTVWAQDLPVPIRVEKQVQVRSAADTVTTSYRVTNRADRAARLRFGIELNWGIVGGDSEHGILRVDGRSYPLADRGEHSDVSTLAVGSTLPDLDGTVTLQLSHRASLWHFPLEAVSQSEAGFERVYQGTCTLLWWDLDLAAGESWDGQLHFVLSAAPPAQPGGNR